MTPRDQAEALILLKRWLAEWDVLRQALKIPVVGPALRVPMADSERLAWDTREFLVIENARLNQVEE
jgi:hypothetical protein